MDPIRAPRRHKPAADSGGNGLLLCVAAVVATIVIIWAARQLHQGGYRITIGKPAAEQPQAATVVRRTVYLCRDAYGRETRQDTPCPAATAPPSPQPAYAEPYREPRPTTPAPNPNQALLDAADARYQREVQSARRAGKELDRKLASLKAGENETAYASYSCDTLCDSLNALRSRMRQQYTAQESVYLHEKQNAIFKAMDQAGCRGCGR